MKIIGIEENQKNTRELNKNKITVTVIASVIVLIIIVLIGIYIGNKSFRELIDKYVLMKNVVEDNVTSIALDESESNYVYAYDKYISVFNKNKLIGYNSSGKKEYELDIEITNPLIDVNNRFLLIAEKNKQKIYLISGSNIVWEKELEGNISRVSVNKNGYVSVILTGTAYKSIIQTFDSNGKEMFKTYLSSSIAMDSDISNDNKNLTFAEISTNGTLVQSIIKTIEIQKEEKEITPILTAPSGSTILNLKYQDGNRIICMYDDSIHCIQNGNDEELFKFEDGNKSVFADIEMSSYAYRIIEKTALFNTESTVQIMNTSNKKINEYVIDSVIKEVYTTDNAIALNLGSEVHFIGTNGWLIKKYISNQEVRKIVMNTNFAGIVYRDKIEIVEF